MNIWKARMKQELVSCNYSYLKYMFNPVLGDSGSHPWMDDPWEQVPLHYTSSKETTYCGQWHIIFWHWNIQAKPSITQGGYYQYWFNKNRGTIPRSLVDQCFSDGSQSRPFHRCTKILECGMEYSISWLHTKYDLTFFWWHVGPNVNEIAPSFQSRVLLDINHSQQDSSVALGIIHMAVGGLLIEMEDLDEQEDEEITNMECPLVQLGLP